MPDGSTDAIVVPGGGLLAGGELPPWVENRLARVLETADGDVPIILLSAGTVYKPHPVDAGGWPIFESCAAAEWLKRRGLPARRLFVETASYDTIGNAYFLRTIHTDPRGWRRLRVVTSEFHMPRLRAIFTWVFGAPPASRPYELNFESVPDVGLSFEVRAARAVKESGEPGIDSRGDVADSHHAGDPRVVVHRASRLCGGASGEAAGQVAGGPD